MTGLAPIMLPTLQALVVVSWTQCHKGARLFPPRLLATFGKPCNQTLMDYLLAPLSVLLVEHV